MDYASFIYLIVGLVLSYLIYDDIKTGELSFIRFFIELVLVYGVIGITFYLTLTFLFDKVYLVVIINSLAVFYGLAFRQNIVNFTENALPPTYDKMVIDDAVSHLKKNNSTPKKVIEYLITRRNLDSEEAARTVLKHFSKEELNNLK